MWLPSIGKTLRSRRLWSQLQRFFATSESAPTRAEPVGDFDIVITWVDHRDPAWARARQRWQAQEADFDHDNSDSRFMDFENLKYLLRAIEAHVAGYRKVFVVTSNPSPAYLRADRDDLVFVDHREIFPDVSCLPVFNSKAIEACLHRIAGLGRHYVYFNDDVFPIARMGTDVFFREGKPRYWSDKMSTMEQLDPDSYNHMGFQGACALLDDTYGKSHRLFLLHNPVPFVRSRVAEIEQQFQVVFDGNRMRRFRGPQGVALTNGLIPYVELYSGNAVLMSPPMINLIRDQKNSWLARMPAKYARPCILWSQFIYIEDNQDWQEEDYTRLKSYLEELYPLRSRFEIA